MARYICIVTDGVYKFSESTKGGCSSQDPKLDNFDDLKIDKKEIPTHVFFCENGEIFQNNFFAEHLRETTSENWKYTQYRKKSDIELMFNIS